MLIYHIAFDQGPKGALCGPLVSGVALRLSLSSGREGSPRRLSTMIAVSGGRGPDSGPVAPQTAMGAALLGGHRDQDHVKITVRLTTGRLRREPWATRYCLRRGWASRASGRFAPRSVATRSPKMLRFHAVWSLKCMKT